ncbi:MAG TPA: hypothetical protein VN806_03150 [Caulobacteraceae bacterium]|nr:hypothetical protein [Caulobacteraceae bacterium]
MDPSAKTGVVSGWTVTPEDDGFHDDFEGSDHPWWTETFWTSFNVPERRMGGWFYNQVLKNQGPHGTNNGGAWVWDGSEAPVRYRRMRQGLPMPPGPRDLRDIALPNGNRIKQLIPNMKYQMHYVDPGRFEADLIFEGVIAPSPHPAGAAPFWRGRHFDQPMHVAGEIVVAGETIAIDCLSVRDRSWSARRPSGGKQSRSDRAPSVESHNADERSDISRPLRKPYNLGYIFGTQSAKEAFLAYTVLIEGEERRGDFLTAGYLVRDGVWAHLVKGERRCLVDTDHGWIWRIEFEGEDTLGRRVVAVGQQQSNCGIGIGLFRWTWNGAEGWGENQGGVAPSYPRVRRGERER